jgi:hypothetical protein
VDVEPHVVVLQQRAVGRKRKSRNVFRITVVNM